MPALCLRVRILLLLLATWTFGVDSAVDVLQPIMDGQDFPDPCIIRTKSGWHVFATNAVVNGNRVNIQAAHSRDFRNWTYLYGYDALPSLPAWVDDDSLDVWAPDVSLLDDGSYVMCVNSWERKARPTLRHEPH